MATALTISPAWQAGLAALGLDSVEVLLGEHPRLTVWRSLPDRQNATLDTPQGRLHLKRYLTPQGAAEAALELTAAGLLATHQIPTLVFAAHGQLPTGQAVTASEDLTAQGYVSAQTYLRNGGKFANVLAPTAALAAQLHAAGLHHRDLYLCHFFYRESDRSARLIDISRVRRLPRFLPGRWIVKDLAQFAYSMREFNLPDDDLTAWLTAYASARGIALTPLLTPLRRKVEKIARHDATLQARQPRRNVSLSH